MKQIQLTLILAFFASALVWTTSSLEAQQVQAKIQLRPAVLPAKPIEPVQTEPGKPPAPTTKPAPKPEPILVPKDADLATLAKFLDHDDYRYREQATVALLEKSRAIVRPMFVGKKPSDAWVAEWDGFVKKSSEVLAQKLGTPLQAAIKPLNSAEATYRVGMILNSIGVERMAILGEWLITSDAPVEAQVPKDDKRPVHVVTTAKEFAKALGNDRIIHIKAKALDLCSNSIPQTKHFTVHPSLKDLKNVRIEALGDAPTKIYISEIARSLDLVNCKNVQVVNLSFTRKTPVAPGMPSQAAAVYISECEGLVLDRCVMNNSWSGFNAVASKKLLFSRCQIMHNYYQLGQLERCQDVRFFATSITANGLTNRYTNYCGIRLRTVKDIYFERSLISGNNMRTLLYFQDSSSRASVENSLVAQQALTNRTSCVKVKNTRVVRVQAVPSGGVPQNIFRGAQIGGGAVIIQNGAVLKR